MAGKRTTIQVPVPSYLRDHCFAGNAVLPAVEAMQLLADAFRKAFPDSGAFAIESAAFNKFLYIKPDSQKIEAFCELEEEPPGRGVAARLLTRERAGKTAFMRIKEHAALRFVPEKVSEIPETEWVKSGVGENAFEIPAGRLYAELVPFGPAYHNIEGALLVAATGAVGTVLAKIAAGSGTFPELLGSPFPLDAAFHAACAWCQRYAGVVGFPVGFGRRQILSPTVPGESYRCRVLPVKTGADEVVFHIGIDHPSEGICEVVSGVRMRDVSAGSLKPPEWVRAGLH